MAPEGTPGRQAQATTKTQTSDLMPRKDPTEIQEVEMSATIATLSAAMRKEMNSGIAVINGFGKKTVEETQ